MRIAVTPLVVGALFVSFFVRREVGVATQAEHGYLYANLAFILCFLVLFVIIFIALSVVKYDPTRLLRIRASGKRIIEFVAFCFVLIGYVYLTVNFAGSLVTGRLAILIVPIPLLLILYLLELRWVNDA